MENTNWNDVFAGARTYIPLMKKAEIVSHCAERCIDRVVVNTGEKFRGDTPPMYRENGQRKRRYLMGILAKAYLRLSFGAAEDDEWLMSADDYDRMGVIHVMNRIERMKAAKGMEREKAYDLIGDFRDLEKMLNTEICADLAVMNDVVARMAMSTASAVTPENLTELVQMADALKSVPENIKSETDK